MIEFGLYSTLMSKGHGLVMRRVLQELTDDEWRPVMHLAADIEGVRDGRTNHSAEESTRRACKRLEREGLVELGYMSMSTGKRLPESRYGIDPAHRRGQKAWLVVRRRAPGTAVRTRKVETKRLTRDEALALTERIRTPSYPASS